MKIFISALIACLVCALGVLYGKLTSGSFYGSWYSGVIHDTTLFNCDVFKRLTITEPDEASLTIFGLKNENDSRVAFVIVEASGKFIFKDGEARCVLKNDGIEFEIERDGTFLLTDTGIDGKKERMVAAEDSELSKLSVVIVE